MTRRIKEDLKRVLTIIPYSLFLTKYSILTSVFTVSLKKNVEHSFVVLMFSGRNVNKISLHSSS